MSNPVAPFARSAETTDVWLTPPEIVRSLGSFTLDPCAPIEAPWRLTPVWYTEQHDGLVQPWIGRVFMNPPYGSATKKWMRRLVGHGDGIALVFARVETQWFHETVWQAADAVMFFKGRIQFLTPSGEIPKSGNAPAPSCLVAYGSHNADVLQQSELGYTVRLRP